MWFDWDAIGDLPVQLPLFVCPALLGMCASSVKRGLEPILARGMASVNRHRGKGGEWLKRRILKGMEKTETAGISPRRISLFPPPFYHATFIALFGGLPLTVYLPSSAYTMSNPFVKYARYP